MRAEQCKANHFVLNKITLKKMPLFVEWRRASCGKAVRWWNICCLFSLCEAYMNRPTLSLYLTLKLSKPYGDVLSRGHVTYCTSYYSVGWRIKRSIMNEYLVPQEGPKVPALVIKPICRTPTFIYIKKYYC